MFGFAVGGGDGLAAGAPKVDTDGDADGVGDAEADPDAEVAAEADTDGDTTAAAGLGVDGPHPTKIRAARPRNTAGRDPNRRRLASAMVKRLSSKHPGPPGASR